MSSDRMLEGSARHADRATVTPLRPEVVPLTDPRLGDDALCAQVGGELFFPEKGGSTLEAKRICNDCEVEAACLGYALANDERFGIWGGLSPAQRRKLQRASGITNGGEFAR